VIFLALEHFFSNFGGNADVAGGGNIVVVIVVDVVVVIEAGVGGGTGDVARRCVFCLGDGVLDEPGSSNFVDCELACAEIDESRLVDGIRNGNPWSSADTDVWRDLLHP
jgi:hypothetical protein